MCCISLALSRLFQLWPEGANLQGPRPLPRSPQLSTSQSQHIDNRQWAQNNVFHEENDRTIIKLNGHLYDITDIKHPGGQAIFDIFRGKIKVGSDWYNGFLHSEKANNVLEKLKMP